MNCLLCTHKENNEGIPPFSFNGEKECIGSIHPRERIDMICAFIDRTYTEDLSRGYLSGLFGLNCDTLSRHFNLYKGMRLCEYINEKRVNHAVQLLNETDYTITKICIECGFDNIRTFNRAFRRVTSMSPSEFRMEVYNEKRNSS